VFSIFRRWKRDRDAIRHDRVLKACDQELTQARKLGAHFPDSRENLNRRTGLISAARSAGLSDQRVVRQLELLNRVLTGLATSIEDEAVPQLVEEARMLELSDAPTIVYLVDHLRTARQTSSEPTARTLNLSSSKGDCDFSIVGESNYQPELRQISKSGRSFVAHVMAEPDNSFDPNAIRVCSERGRTIGYFSREYAQDYHEVFTMLARGGHIGSCRAKLIGGVGAKKSFGAMLNIGDSEDLLVLIRDTLNPGTSASSSVNPF
jgi:HIRAN domain